MISEVSTEIRIQAEAQRQQRREKERNSVGLDSMVIDTQKEFPDITVVRQVGFIATEEYHAPEDPQGKPYISYGHIYADGYVLKAATKEVFVGFSSNRQAGFSSVVSQVPTELTRYGVAPHGNNKHNAGEIETITVQDGQLGLPQTDSTSAAQMKKHIQDEITQAFGKK